MAVGWAPRLVWEKDADGYRLEEHQPSKGASLLGGVGSYWCIRGNGGKPKTVTFYRDRPLVCLDFANTGALRTRQPEALLEFVNQYGRLACDDIDGLVESVWDVRGALDAIRKGNHAELGKGLATRKNARSAIGFEYIDGEMTLIVEAGSLTSFIYAQTAYLVASRARIGICPQCFKFMLIKSTKRETCSEACKKRGHRLKSATDGPHQGHAMRKSRQIKLLTS